MKLIWLSDLHLEFVEARQVSALTDEIVRHKPDAVLITGDISNARLLEFHLGLLAESLSCPVYFVLGNHDFYLGSFAQVNAVVEAVRARHPHLIELGHGEIVPLGSDTALIGHRGWADGRAGQGSRSRIRLNDHQYIADLRTTDAPQLFAELNRLGDESADYIRKVGSLALDKAQNLIVATHVPPFVQAALYENKPSEPAYAPHFVNVALGQAVWELAQAHPNKSITVLSGHTHHRAFYTATPNLKVEVAGAEYYHPRIAAILTIP